MDENPWLDLPDTPPFVLPGDREQVNAFNTRADPSSRLYLDLIPEAFMGRREAPLVLLGNVAGVSDTGGGPAPYRLLPAFMARMRNNLSNNQTHIDSTHPFVYLDPVVNPHLRTERDWWGHMLRHVLAEFQGGDTDNARVLLAQNMSAVEFFPYVVWGNRYSHDNLRLPSQEYSFDLVRAAVERKAVIVVRHGERRWLQAAPQLVGYSRLVTMSSYQKGLISPRNCLDNGWSLIREGVAEIETTAMTPCSA